MTTEDERNRHAKRIQRTERAIKRQLKIAKGSYHVDPNSAPDIKQPHRLHKRHAMDCGNPACGLCGNPRHLTKKGQTVQEQRFYQEMDVTRNRHNNGTSVDDTE